jgi:hypothetical protein
MLRPIINVISKLHPDIKITWYMDDILLSANNPRDLKKVTSDAIFRLKNLGFRINEKK